MVLQKKAIRINTFSDFQAHTSLLFKKLNLLKFLDIVDLYTAVFTFRYSIGNLPVNFNPTCNYTHLLVTAC